MEIKVWHKRHALQLSGQIAVEKQEDAHAILRCIIKQLADVYDDPSFFLEEPEKFGHSVT